jgi:hypothetical protein
MAGALELLGPYIRELSSIRDKKAYWSTVHLIVVIPDICAALDSSNGRTNGNLYAAWCDRYVATPQLSGQDWYQIRCALLHQGRATFDEAERIRYTSVSFVDPDSAPAARHGHVADGNLTVNIANMSTEMLAAIGRWATDVDGRPAVGRVHIERNKGTLVREQPKHATYEGIEMRFNSTSST